MNDEVISAFADRLLEAYQSGVPIAPLTDEAPDATVEDAYAIQLAQVDRWLADGREITGFKVGLTSKAMQRQLKVDSPDFGHLFDDMVLDTEAPIDLKRFIAPRIEPEISFVLGRDLSGPGLTLDDLRGSIDYAVASMEIIDSRIADWRIGLADTIADNASSGALVVGSRRLAIDEVELDLVGNILTRNDEIVTTGAGAAVLGHPLNAALFLANTLGAFGRSLPAGSIVMAGALSGSVPISPGDTFTARFSALGDVTATFGTSGGTT